MVLADVGTALGMKHAIAFRAAEHVNDFLPMSKRDIIKFEGPQLAWKRALAEAKLDLLDLSFVESHDCFTSAELIEYEAMGLTAPGEGERAIHEGWVERDGKLPVNVSGGLKAKGHPVGATGVQHARDDGHAALRHRARRACSCPRPRSAACSTWAAPPSPTT